MIWIIGAFTVSLYIWLAIIAAQLRDIKKAIAKIDKHAHERYRDIAGLVGSALRELWDMKGKPESPRQ